MPTALPSVEDMLEQANKRQGIEIEKLKEAIGKYSKQFSKVIRSERLSI